MRKRWSIQILSVVAITFVSAAGVGAAAAQSRQQNPTCEFKGAREYVLPSTCNYARVQGSPPNITLGVDARASTQADCTAQLNSKELTLWNDIGAQCWKVEIKTTRRASCRYTCGGVVWDGGIVKPGTRVGPAAR